MAILHLLLKVGGVQPLWQSTCAVMGEGCSTSLAMCQGAGGKFVFCIHFFLSSLGLLQGVASKTLETI